MEAIGGFPTYSISEDTGCSSMLVGHGWSVAYVDEKLQCGYPLLPIRLMVQ